MLYNNIVNKCEKHKCALFFEAGIAASIVDIKIIWSKIVKDAATWSLTFIMLTKKDYEEYFNDIR